MSSRSVENRLDGEPKWRTIQFSDRDIADASRLFQLITAEQPFSQRSSSLDLTALARALIQERKQRAVVFSPGMFGEPAWDILLMLYGFDKDGPRLTIGQVLAAIGCASSTGHRWIEYLEGSGFTERQPHPTDGRTSFLKLTEKAREALSAYLSGLPLARLETP